MGQTIKPEAVKLEDILETEQIKFHDDNSAPLGVELLLVVPNGCGWFRVETGLRMGEHTYMLTKGEILSKIKGWAFSPVAEKPKEFYGYEPKDYVNV